MQRIFNTETLSHAIMNLVTASLDIDCHSLVNLLSNLLLLAIIIYFVFVHHGSFVLVPT